MLNEQQFIDAARKSPFYKELLDTLKSPTWADIPFTTKQQLRDATPYDLLGTSVKNIATYPETSGTTVQPSSSWYSQQDIDVEAVVLTESALQLNENDLILNRFPFAIAVPAFLLYWAAQKVKAGFISADVWSQIAPLTRVLSILEKTKPTDLANDSTEIMKLYHVAKELGQPLPTEKLRAIVVAGEIVSPARKKYIEKCWGVPVYSFYGSTETGGIFVSCEQGHFHLDHPKLKVEVVDDAGQIVEPGTVGHCVISTAREGMPLLRYFNHDRVEVKSAETCTCGNSLPVLLHYGRQDDVITVEQRTYSLYDIQEIIYTLSTVPFMWKLQLKGEDLHFCLQYKESIDLATIQQELTIAFETQVTVEAMEILPIDTLIPSLKGAGKFSYIEKIETVQV